MRLLRATPGRDATTLPSSDEPVDLSVGDERLRVSLDDVASEEPGLGLREVAPGHQVLCRPLVGVSAASVQQVASR